MAPERQKTLLERNKFFGTTGISGFGFIQSSNSRIETAVWYVMIVFFATLTIRNIIDLTDQFKNQSPITVVERTSIDRATGLTPLILSLDITWHPLNPEYSDEVTDPSPFNYSIPLNEDFDDALHYLDTKWKLLNERWPYVLMHLMDKYCFFMSLCEQEQNGYCYWNVVKGFTPLINKFLNHARKLGVQFHQLHQTFGYQIMKWTGFNHAENWKDYYNLISCRDKFVFKILPPDNNSLFGDSFESFGRPVWYINFDLADPLFKTFSQLFNRSSNVVEKWYLNVTRKPEVNVGAITETAYYKKEPVTAKLGELKTAWLEIYSSYHTVGSCCLTTIEHTNCIYKCSANEIAGQCGCLPVIWETQLYGNYEWCSPEQYMKCLSNHTRNRTIETPCVQKCPEQCDYYVTDINLKDTLIGMPNQCQIKLMGSEGLQYPRFQQVYGQSFMSYLAELGGAFDFWLGANVLAGVHVIVYLIKQIVYAFKKGTKTGKHVRQMVGQGRNEHQSIIEMMTSLTMAISTEKDDENAISSEKYNQIQEQLAEEKERREELEKELKEVKLKMMEISQMIYKN